MSNDVALSLIPLLENELIGILKLLVSKLPQLVNNNLCEKLSTFVPILFLSSSILKCINILDTNPP